jgi:CBS domain-containing protein
MVEVLATLPLSQLPARQPVKVKPTTRLADVVTAMREAHHGSALICEDDGSLVGIFTERDLLRRVDHRTPAWQDQRVSTVMTAQPMIIREDDTFAEAMRRMDLGKLRHLPVMRGRIPVGIISIRDLLGYIASRFSADFINLPPDPDNHASKPWGG